MIDVLKKCIKDIGLQFILNCKKDQFVTASMDFTILKKDFLNFPSAWILSGNKVKLLIIPNTKRIIQI